MLAQLNRWADYALLFFNENHGHGRAQVEQIRDTAFPQITPNRASSIIDEPLDDSDPADRNECLVCYENPPNTVIVACGHQALCEQCARAHKFQECPFCRAPIPDQKTGIIKVYKC